MEKNKHFFAVTIAIAIATCFCLLLSHSRLSSSSPNTGNFVMSSSNSESNSSTNTTTTSSSTIVTTDTNLSDTLKRGADGKAAVVIIVVVAEESESESGSVESSKTTPTPVKYLLQRKSIDYPIPSFQNALCLYGGNAEAQDATPRQTLLRELKEELPTALVTKAIEPTLMFRQYALHSFSSQLLNNNNNNHNNRRPPYAFVCALYEARISLTDYATYFENNDNNNNNDNLSNTEEGSVVFLSQQELLETKDNYAWGYDSTMTRYFQNEVDHFVVGATVTDVGSNPFLENGGLGVSWNASL